ncbi:MAG: hypothetical protein M3Y76_10575, partial [Chloroflexota bacterium]|nr:hypothetical protein [Chloroflexota bacterium]
GMGGQNALPPGRNTGPFAPFYPVTPNPQDGEWERQQMQPRSEEQWYGEQYNQHTGNGSRNR